MFMQGFFWVDGLSIFSGMLFKDDLNHPQITNAYQFVCWHMVLLNFARVKRMYNSYCQIL